MIKVCAISDFHGFLPKDLPPCDLLLIAGDISPFSIQGYKKHMNMWIKERFNPWIRSLDCKRVILVPGNHDFALQSLTKRKKDLLFNDVYHKLSLLINEGETLMINGQTIKIFGSPYCHKFGNWAFMREDSELNKKFESIPNDLDILVTHDAPYWFGDICLDTTIKPGEHIGSMPLLTAIERTNPKWAIHGHLHSADHNPIKINNTTSVNVALLDEYCEYIKYKPFEFEL